MGDSDSLVLHELVEALVDLLVQVVEVLAHLVLWQGWWHELHLVDLGDDVLWAGEGLLDESHGDLLVSLGRLGDDAQAVLVELHNGLHHADGLVQWAVVVVLTEGVLLEELILDDLGSLFTKHGVVS